jgi:hypothetical protein
MIHPQELADVHSAARNLKLAAVQWRQGHLPRTSAVPEMSIANCQPPGWEPAGSSSTSCLAGSGIPIEGDASSLRTVWAKTYKIQAVIDGKWKPLPQTCWSWLADSSRKERAVGDTSSAPPKSNIGYPCAKAISVAKNGRFSLQLQVVP